MALILKHIARLLFLTAMVIVTRDHAALGEEIVFVATGTLTPSPFIAKANVKFASLF